MADHQSGGSLRHIAQGKDRVGGAEKQVFFLRTFRNLSGPFVDAQKKVDYHKRLFQLQTGLALSTNAV
jgi:hypothetical protein